MLRHKNIIYVILYYSNLQLTTVYNVYISLQKTTKLRTKYLPKPHFVGSCGQEVLFRRSAISPRQPSASTETNPVLFLIPKANIFIAYAI